MSVNPTAESATSTKLPTVIRGFAAFALSVLVAGCASQPSQSHAYQAGYTDGQSGAAANMAQGGVTPGNACEAAALSEYVSSADRDNFLHGCTDALHDRYGTTVWYGSRSSS